MTQADVMPLGLAQQDHRLYLVCRFRGYENERNLALHRIRASTVLTITFDRSVGFDVEKYDNEEKFGIGERKRIHLSFQATRWLAEIQKETKLLEDQEIKELDDGKFEIRAKVADGVRLGTWVRGFGDATTHIKKEPIDQESDKS